MSEIEQDFLLPKKDSNKKTLVLDLDETLVHSQFQPFDIASDVTLTIELDNEIHDIYILIRPGVKQFLEKMSKIYEIVIFTASVSKYADPLIDFLDKENNCKYRLFREHCTQINEIFVKELKYLRRDLKDVIILDNSPMSYCLNPENGLPILSWFEDKDDRELYKIIPIMEFLSVVPDVRSFINKFIVNDQICYKTAYDIIDEYNELLLMKNNGQNISKNKNIIKKNNSVKSSQFLPVEDKENISNNINNYGNISHNNNSKKKNNCSLNNNRIIIRQNSKKNYNEMNYYQINNDNNSNTNNIHILNSESSLFNFQPCNNFIKQNQTTKNKDLMHINYMNYNSCINPNIANPTKSYINLISKIKPNKTNNSNRNNNNYIKIRNKLLINKHKKSESVNGVKPLKKIYENKNQSIKINKSKTNFIRNFDNNSVLKYKNKIVNKNHSLNMGCGNNNNNNNNSNSSIYINNNLNMSKNSGHGNRHGHGHKYGIQLFLKMNDELNYELDKLIQSELLNNKKLSKSLSKEKYKTHKSADNNNLINNYNSCCTCTCTCNKSSILNNSRINDVYLYNKISHKKSKSNINSFSFIPKIKESKQKVHLSTSESYNNKNFLRKMNLNKSTSNNTTIDTLTVQNKKNDSQRKINILMNKKIFKLSLNTNTNTNKDKKRGSKIPYNTNANKKKNAQNEKFLKNKIPINKKVVIKINNNNKNNRYNYDKNEYEYIEPENITLRPKSSQKVIYRKINRSINKSNNNSFKEGINDKEDVSQKCNFGNIINNIIYVNNIIKNNDIVLTKNYKQYK